MKYKDPLLPPNQTTPYVSTATSVMDYLGEGLKQLCMPDVTIENINSSADPDLINGKR